MITLTNHSRKHSNRQVNKQTTSLSLCYLNNIDTRTSTLLIGINLQKKERLHYLLFIQRRRKSMKRHEIGCAYKAAKTCLG